MSRENSHDTAGSPIIFSPHLFLSRPSKRQARNLVKTLILVRTKTVCSFQHQDRLKSRKHQNWIRTSEIILMNTWKCFCKILFLKTLLQNFLKLFLNQVFLTIIFELLPRCFDEHCTMSRIRKIVEKSQDLHDAFFFFEGEGENSPESITRNKDIIRKKESIFWNFLNDRNRFRSDFVSRQIIILFAHYLKKLYIDVSTFLIKLNIMHCIIILYKTYSLYSLIQFSNFDKNWIKNELESTYLIP